MDGPSPFGRFQHGQLCHWTRDRQGVVTNNSRNLFNEIGFDIDIEPVRRRLHLPGGFRTWIAFEGEAQTGQRVFYDNGFNIHTQDPRHTLRSQPHFGS